MITLKNIVKGLNLWPIEMYFKKMLVKIDEHILVYKWNNHNNWLLFLDWVVRKFKEISYQNEYGYVSHVKRIGKRVVGFIASLAFKLLDFYELGKDANAVSNIGYFSLNLIFVFLFFLVIYCILVFTIPDLCWLGSR